MTRWWLAALLALTLVGDAWVFTHCLTDAECETIEASLPWPFGG